MQDYTHAPQGQKSAQLDFSRGINLMIGKLEHIEFTNVEAIKDYYKIQFCYLRLLYYLLFCCNEPILIILFACSFVGALIFWGLIVQVLLPFALFYSLLTSVLLLFVLFVLITCAVDPCMWSRCPNVLPFGIRLVIHLGYSTPFC